MRTLTPRLIPTRNLRNGDSIGAHWTFSCPHCGTTRSQTIWTSEFADRKLRTDTINVCLHFDGITKGGKIVVRAKMSVVAAGNVVRVNGVKLEWSLSQLLDQLENLSEEAESQDWISWPEWCPRRRFEALKEEAWRVQKANPERWKAQHAARHEENERAELARLMAKYPPNRA